MGTIFRRKFSHHSQGRVVCRPGERAPGIGTARYHCHWRGDWGRVRWPTKGGTRWHGGWGSASVPRGSLSIGLRWNYRDSCHSREVLGTPEVRGRLLESEWEGRPQEGHPTLSSPLQMAGVLRQLPSAQGRQPRCLPSESAQPLLESGCPLGWRRAGWRGRCYWSRQSSSARQAQGDPGENHRVDHPPWSATPVRLVG